MHVFFYCILENNHILSLLIYLWAYIVYKPTHLKAITFQRIGNKFVK